MDRGYSMLLDKRIYNYASGFIFKENQELIKDMRFIGGSFGY